MHQKAKRLQDQANAGDAVAEESQTGWFRIPLLFVLTLIVSSHQLCRAQDVALVGSGSTLSASLYAAWAAEYNKRSAKIQMHYLPLGTNGGIDLISHGHGDFAAGEVPLSAQERAQKNLVQLPALLIAIVPIYNVPGVHELRFTGALLADIFLGRVKTWNAPAIAKLNPEVSLPNLPINVVYRPPGRGSNYVFTDFLSKASPEFRAEIGASTSPTWPIGVPAERSPDMVEKVAGQAGSIGYVEVQFAVKTRIPFGSVLNSGGHFVKASGESVAAACQAVEAPEWQKFSASLTDAPGADSYPITSFTWLYLRTSADDRRRSALVNLLSWIMTEGQRMAVQDGYFELPAPLLARMRSTIDSLR